jgi:hypothetical protein
MNFVQKAEKLKTRHATLLANFANARMEVWRREFTQRHPRFHGRLLFGMGTEVLVLNCGRNIHVPDCGQYRAFTSLRAAVDDVLSITDGYMSACPDDVEF